MAANLEHFCWQEAIVRYPGTQRPFQQGGWRYATDGRIAVRLPRKRGAKPWGKVPEASVAFDSFAQDKCTEPWPAWDRELCCMGRGLWDEAVTFVPAPQKVAGRRIAGSYWLLVASLGKVYFNPEGTPEDIIQFVCGKLQGILMPLGLAHDSA